MLVGGAQIDEVQPAAGRDRQIAIQVGGSGHNGHRVLCGRSTADDTLINLPGSERLALLLAWRWEHNTLLSAEHVNHRFPWRPHEDRRFMRSGLDIVRLS